MVPQVLSIIQIQFAGAERTKALGLYATVISAGAVAGQVVGGALATADLFGTSWRPVFLVNVPIGALLLLAGRRTLAATRGQSARRRDLRGVALLSAAALLVMLPLILGQTQHWPLWTYASFAGGAVFVIVGVRYLRALGRRGGDPLIDLAIFADAGVARGLASIFASFVAYGGFLFAFSFYLQSGLGDSPLRSGLIYAPLAIAFAVVSLGHARLGAGVVRWLPLAGLGSLAAGYVTLGMINQSGDWHVVLSIVLLVVVGAGFGAGFSPVIGLTVARVPPRHAPDASGLLNTTIQLGYVTGVASLGSYFVAVAKPGNAASSGHAFFAVSIGLAALAVVAALLAVSIRRSGAAA